MSGSYDGYAVLPRELKLLAPNPATRVFNQSSNIISSRSTCFDTLKVL